MPQSERNNKKEKNIVNFSIVINKNGIRNNNNNNNSKSRMMMDNAQCIHSLSRKVTCSRAQAKRNIKGNRDKTKILDRFIEAIEIK